MHITLLTEIAKRFKLTRYQVQFMLMGDVKNALLNSQITKELKEYGFDEHGYEHMYCGMTGKKILSKIFMGPTFYLRLKHMVQDKIHCLTIVYCKKVSLFSIYKIYL
jgi:hypothetical protein